MTRLTAPWLDDPDALAVTGLLRDAGYRAWFVGGCVRDALLGVPGDDIDIATDAVPRRVQELAEAAGVRAVPTGIEHGTVTLIRGGRPFEVTTLRRDVSTDGRRAVVAFSDRLEEDAARRDFTINAIYADAEGAIIDPVGGVADLAARRVRFVGDAGTRVREDYLRALRYFRFYARFGDPEQGPDPAALAAVSANLAGIETLSAERVGWEVRKLLATPDPAPAVAAMAATGALATVLPGSDPRALAPLVHLEAGAGLAPDPVRRLAALGGPDPTARLRLSRAEARGLAAIRQGLGMTPGEAGYRLGADRARDAVVVAAALSATEVTPDALAMAEAGAKAEFPVAAADLAPLAGPDLGRRLNEIEAAWIASGFLLGRDDLLS